MLTRTSHRQIITLPNLLSVLRIALIPPIVLFIRNGQALPSAALLITSGLTDLLDGWIARRFDAVSNVGKILDPVADKLTIAALLFTLLSAHAALWLPFVILIVREVMMGVVGAIAIGCTSVVPSACWHGKAATAMLYGTMFAHIIWQDIPVSMSNILCVACTVMMIASLLLYMRDHLSRIRRREKGALIHAHKSDQTD